MLPSTLKEISGNAFDDCLILKTVLVEDGCAVDVRKHVGDNVEVRRK